jgi:hypothetical protein
LIGGGVRAGISGPQLAAQRLTGLLRVGEHRVKPEAALERPRGTLLLGVADDQRGVEIVSGCGAPISVRTRSRARACAARSRSSPPGSRAIASITRKARRLVTCL